MACVSEATMGGLSTRGDNGGRQVCVDQTLHRPSILLLPSTSAFPPLLYLWDDAAAAVAASIVLLCEVRSRPGGGGGCGGAGGPEHTHWSREQWRR